MPIDEYFAQSYSEARRKFVDAATQAGSGLASYVLPDRSGPTNEELVVDVARIGSQEPRNLLLIISGTHGVEGFCGSGCQVGYFAEQLFQALLHVWSRQQRGVLLIRLRCQQSRQPRLGDVEPSFQHGM